MRGAENVEALAKSGVQQASLKQEDVLKPGDTVRTGRTGRVLLKRGDEMILVSPNSVVGVPAQKKEGLSTTIMQQAGSILLDVEKRNVKHFEVETPYLAAVVKGTQFRVTVNAGKTTVDVVRGQVEVADFKSGQIAQVMAGQHATAFANGKTGLSLGGSGALAPIEQGKPRAPSVERVPVPRGGFTAIRHATNGQGVQPSRHASVHPARHGVTRISSSIGEVRVNVHRVTNGLAHATSRRRMAAARNAAEQGHDLELIRLRNRVGLSQQWPGQQRQRCCECQLPPAGRNAARWRPSAAATPTAAMAMATATAITATAIAAATMAPMETATEPTATAMATEMPNGNGNGRSR